MSSVPMIEITDTHPYLDPSCFSLAFSSVSPARQEKIARMRRAEDQRLSLAAGVLLNRALSKAGFDSSAYTLSEGPNGKPYFPELASRFSFSLSHSGEKALCVWVPSGLPVGCDIQLIGNLPLELADRFFHPAETADIRSRSSPEAQCRRFYRFWALKESFLKATGKGLSRPMNSFEIRIGADDSVSVVCPPDGYGYTFGEPDAGTDYACAWCLMEPVSSGDQKTSG